MTAAEDVPTGFLLQDVELSDVEFAEFAERWRAALLAANAADLVAANFDPRVAMQRAASNAPSGSAWRHECGCLNDGLWINPLAQHLFCEGCNRAVRHDGEIVGKYTLRPASGGAS